MFRFHEIWLATNIAIVLISNGVFSCDLLEHFECDDGECISRGYLCNDYDECQDKSDEDYCDCRNGPSCYNKPQPCNNKFRCTSGACIPSSWECDGEYDCADRSDEHNQCIKQRCDIKQFTCDNGICIDARLKCNSKNDCGDNSDESICQVHPANGVPSYLNQTDCGNSFRCKDGTCIGYNLVCNSVPQCPDGSDEGGKCTVECEEEVCGGSVQKTPSGCKCTCPMGYRLAGDGLTCSDIFDCAKDPPVCSQLCTEVEGSYACKCFHEFAMRYDKVSCKSQSNKMLVFYAVRNEIREFSPFRRNLRILHVESDAQLSALDVDIAAGVIYYGTRERDNLYQLVIANSSRKSIMNVGSVERLAVDWITQNVYFISKTTRRTDELEQVTTNSTTTNVQSRLVICNFGDRHCATIQEFDTDISAIAVDALNKKLFYASATSDDNDTQTFSRLFRTGLDGQNPQTLTPFEYRIWSKTITDMTVDYRRRYIYVVAGTSINRLDYDGERMLNIVDTSIPITGLNLFEDHLYFLSQEGQTMHKCRLFGDARRCTSFRLSAEPTEMFVIAERTRQTPGRNPCITYNCSHLCTPNDIGVTCHCENGNIVDELSDCRA